jgi:hypothetical protein
MLRLRSVILVGVLAASSALAVSKPIDVSVEKLEAVPQRFNGKRIAFVAYYDSDGHAMSFRRRRSTDYPRIFADFSNRQIPIHAIRSVPLGSLVPVAGTFRYSKMKVTRGKDFNYIVPGFGWMNSYDRKISNITQFTRVNHR